MLRRVSRFAGAKRCGDQSRLHGHVHAGDTKGLWGSYLRFLGTRPISAGLATGFTLWTIGDCAAQRLDPTKPFDIRRALATGVFGGVVAGAVASEWYRLLEYLATHVLALRPGSWRFVAFKLGLEFVLWHPFSLITFWFTVGLIDGRDVKAIRAEVSEEFRPTILTEYALWAPLDFVNFWKVPVKYQVAVVNLGCFVESVMLSYIHENGFPKIFGDGHADLPVAAAPIIPELGANNKYGDKPSRVLAWQRAIRPSGISSKFGKKFADIQKQIDKEWPRGDLTRQEVERVMRGEASLPGLRNDALSVTCSAILYRKMEAEGRDTVAKDSYVRFIKAFQESGFRMKVLAEVCFALFDADNDGYLDEGEMRNLVSVVTGQSMDGLAVHQLMQQVSTSTRLSKQDFVELVTASTQNTTTPA